MKLERLSRPELTQYPENAFFHFHGCGIHESNEKTDCYFYHGEYHMGATIPTCNYYQKLGYCPCGECGKYVSGKEVRRRVYDAVKEYVDGRDGESE